MLEERKEGFITYPPDLPITIEMHFSYWDDLFLDYSVRDLLVGGELYENYESLPLSEYTKRCIGLSNYNVYGKDPQWFAQDYRSLSNYLYIGDYNGKMNIYHRKPLPSNFKSSSHEINNNSRFYTT